MFAIYGKMTSTRSAEYNDREKAYHPRKPVEKVAFKTQFKALNAQSWRKW